MLRLSVHVPVRARLRGARYVRLCILIASLVICFHVVHRKFSSNKSQTNKSTEQNRSKNQTNTLYSNNEWLINNNIIQYSSYVILKSQNQTRIESIIILIEPDATPDLMSNPMSPDPVSVSSLRCVVKSKDDNLEFHTVTELYHHVENIQHTNFNLMGKMYKVSCHIETNSDKPDDYTHWTVAIIENKAFDETLDRFDEDRKISPVSYIQFQVAKKIDGRKAKKKAVAHCVHSVYDLDAITSTSSVTNDNQRLKSMTNFLNLQYSVSMGNIRIYIKRQRSNTDFLLTEIFNDPRKFTLIHYPLSYAELCKKPIEFIENHPNSKAYDHMYKQCRLAYKLYFQALVVPGTWNMHEVITSNDCYINFRYLYEFVTNFDFDELIIPHRSRMGDKQTYYHKMDANNVSMCHAEPVKFDIYNYSSHLFQRYSANNVGAILLSHVVMVPFVDDLNQFFITLDLYLKNHSSIGFNESISVQYRSIELFIRNEEDVDYARDLIRLYSLVKYLNDEYIGKSSEVSHNFNRAVAIHMPIRLGKAIFNTDFCEVLNVHGPDFNRGNTTEVNNMDLLHFREDVDSFTNQYYQLSIKSIFVDMEYYHFILRKLTNFVCL
jgi:hypothetical protein